MTDRPCRPRALVMFTPPEAEDLVCEDTADLLLARAAVTGVRPMRYEREGRGAIPRRPEEGGKGTGGRRLESAGTQPAASWPGP